MSRGREAAVADAQCRGGGSVVASGAARRGRCSFFFDGDDEPPSTTAGRMRCRSCAAVAIADCVALGCCPCAVVSLLGLALVKAPLVVGRRCVGRLRRRRRLLLHNKRVRDVAAASASAPAATRIHGEKGGVKAEVVTAGAGNAPPGSAAAAASVAVASPLGAPGTEAELAWLEEMYRVGHWGFGRVSFSGKTTP
ncbi:hypothetical protein EJB05_36480, partial [Eragrostis curvula]